MAIKHFFKVLTLFISIIAMTLVVVLVVNSFDKEEREARVLQDRNTSLAK
jgi:hypothetical protein